MSRRMSHAAVADIRALCDAIPAALDSWDDPRYPTPDIIDVAGHANLYRWNTHGEYVTRVALRAFAVRMRTEVALRAVTP